MKKLTLIVLPVLLCLTVGFIASLTQSHSIATWYPTLNKPPFTPPNIVFPIVWTILYIFMGVSVGLILNLKNTPLKKLCIVIFIIQLAINFLWSIAFFYFKSPVIALIDLVVLDTLVITYILKSYPLSKVSAYLFVPYLIWIAYATYLNITIILLN